MTLNTARFVATDHAGRASAVRRGPDARPLAGSSRRRDRDRGRGPRAFLYHLITANPKVTPDSRWMSLVSKKYAGEIVVCKDLLESSVTRGLRPLDRSPFRDLLGSAAPFVWVAGGA